MRNLIILSRAAFEPIEKCKMTFPSNSSNSRGLHKQHSVANRVFSLLSDNRKTDFLLSMLFRDNVINCEVCVHTTHVSKSVTQLDSCRKVCF